MTHMVASKFMMIFIIVLPKGCIIVVHNSVVLSVKTWNKTVSESENVGVMERIKSTEVGPGYGCYFHCRKKFRISASITAMPAEAEYTSTSDHKNFRQSSECALSFSTLN